MLIYSKWLIRISAIYGVIGALIGSDLAGRKDYTMVPGHAHILVVGWLTLFAYGIFYYVFKNEISMMKTAKLHAWTSLIGGGLMPLSMLIYNMMENTATTIIFITTASFLLLAMILFMVLLFFDKKIFSRNEL